MSVDLLPLHQRDRDEVVRLFARYPYKTWQKDVQRIAPERLAQLLWDLLEPHVGRPRTSAWVAWRQQPRESVGLIVMVPHEWHTEVFRRPIGRILHFVNYVEPAKSGPLLLAAVLTDARAAGIEHLSCRVDGQDWPNVHLLESEGFRCVDCSLKLARRLDDLPAKAQTDPGEMFEVRRFEPSDLEAVQRIATRSHTHNHFYNDPQLPRERSAILFQEWLRRCAGGTAAFVLVAADRAGQVVGFVTVLSNAALARVTGIKVGIIDYIVVDQDVAGRGIGRLLLAAALRSLADGGHEWAELRTSQDNYRALAFYGANGFRIVGSDFVFHWWQQGGKQPVTADKADERNWEKAAG